MSYGNWVSAEYEWSPTHRHTDVLLGREELVLEPPYYNESEFVFCF